MSQDQTTRAKSARVLEVEAAMAVLLTKHQVAAVKARTFAGRSKVEVVRRLVRLGLEAEETDAR